MGRNIRTEAVVLKTYNVGESDRYCILLTKDFGRIHVRANGARKTTSALGPYLLGMQCIEVELYKSSKSTTVRSAHLLASALQQTTQNTIEPIIECCLALLPEDVPMPAIYTIVKTSLTNSESGYIPALLQIMHNLGYLPDVNDPQIIAACTKEEHVALQTMLTDPAVQLQPLSTTFRTRLLRWLTKKIEHESGKPLRSLK